MKRYENESEYNDERQTIPWGRMIVIAISLLAIFIVILLLLRSCSNNDKASNLENDLLNAGKKYYAEKTSLLPNSTGECRTVILSELLRNKLLDSYDYKTCNGEKTYVKVCKLESGMEQYIPILSCEKEKTTFNTWNEGTESDIIKDSTDVRFTFLGEEFKSTTTSSSTTSKAYYPNNASTPSGVSNYYVTSPAKGYTQKDSKTDSAYKWYTEKTGKSYWNNGEYSSTQPKGYTIKGNSKTITKTTTTKPSTASYRTIKENTLYRTGKVAYAFKYECVDPNLSRYNSQTGKFENTLISTTKCEERNSDTFKNTANIYYTCDGVNQVSKGSECSKFSDWTTTKCESNSKTGVVCEKKTGYTYTDKVWQWYKETTVKSYYPSGATSANKENTYYVSSPIKGAIKDTSTKATAYKFYKNIESGDEITNEEWTVVTDGYVTETELVQKFSELGYNVSSLKDILNNEKIRYQVKLEYRNRISK